MPTGIAACGGFNARWGEWKAGDVLEGPEEDLRPVCTPRNAPAPVPEEAPEPVEPEE